MSDETTLNTKGIDKLLKTIKKPPTVKVGIIGDHDAREDGESNATIGAQHEFGTSTLPQRSFLRMPLQTKLFNALEDSGILNQKEIDEVVKNGSFATLLRKIGKEAEGVIRDAFDSGGFGEWIPSHMENKKVKQTLVETGDLRKSISSEVKE